MIEPAGDRAGEPASDQASDPASDRADKPASTTYSLAALKALAATEAGLSCAVSDALGRVNGLSYAVAPAWPGARLVGTAVTARPAALDVSAVFRAIASCGPGDVIVVADAAETDAAYWGENASLAAQFRGAAGAVVGAACRDVAAHQRLGFPVFAKGATPRGASFGEGGAVQVAIEVGGVAVRPGDVIVADENGVVVIPRERFDDVTSALPRVIERDLAVQRMLAAGGDLLAARAQKLI